MNIHSVEVKSLRPTQIAVGALLVKAKRKGLRAHAKRPTELVNYILEHPIRVVTGPKGQFFVVDHHHLVHALLDEGFETAPVVVLQDYSKLSKAAFWSTMEKQAWVYPFDGGGKKRAISAIPLKIRDMEDDPFRSLAGIVRRQGGFRKTARPYAEFKWAQFFREHFSAKQVKKNFDKTVKQAMGLAQSDAAKAFPGYLRPAK